MRSDGEKGAQCPAEPLRVGSAAGGLAREGRGMESGSVGFLGLGRGVLPVSERSLDVSGAVCGRRAHRTAPSMNYAKKNKKKKKLMKSGLIKKPEDTRLMDLPLPKTLEGSIAIVWFRKDLRTRDNEALALANTADSVLPIYIFDERDFGSENLSSFGFEKTSAYQAAFLRESVANLRRNLRLRASELYIRTGKPEQIIAEICREYLSLGKNVNVLVQKEVTKEETTVEFLLQRSLKRISKIGAQAKLHLVWGSTLHHIEDLPYTASNFFPISFTTFKTRMDRKRKQGIVREEIPAPEMIKDAPEPEIDRGELPSLSEDLKVSGLMEPLDLEKPFPIPQACYDWHGGEDSALWRIDDYIWKKDGLYHYSDTKNQSGSSDFSTKLSSYLALGCVSPRTVYWELQKYQEKHSRKLQQGSFQLEVQLQWRDFFRLTAVVYKNQLFARDGLGQRDRKGRLTARTFAKREPTEEQWEKIRRWMDGRTGVPYIDAAMRELNLSGYMSNRCRQNCASYLMHDIECPDWRIGAEYFQSKLVDHDVTSNWMGWQYVSAVSNDPKHGKRYPVVKQAVFYDELGLFVRRWLPELSSIPTPEIHAPSLLSDIELEQYQVKMGETYPEPVVPLWRLPSELERPTYAPVQAPAQRQRRSRLEEEVEELVGTDTGDDEDEGEAKFFVETVESEEHVDDLEDFYKELMSLEDAEGDAAGENSDDDEEEEEEEGLGDVEEMRLQARASAEEDEIEEDEELLDDDFEDEDLDDLDGPLLDETRGNGRKKGDEDARLQKEDRDAVTTSDTAQTRTGDSPKATFW